MGNLVATDVEKDEVLNNFPPAPALSFHLTIALPKSLQSLNLKAGTGGKKTYPCRRRSGSRTSEEPEHTQGHGTFSDEMHARVLRELADGESYLSPVICIHQRTAHDHRSQSPGVNTSHEARC